MANIKSAKKRIKTIKRNTDRNKKFKSEIKTLQKKAEAAITGKVENVTEAVKTFIKRLDSAVSKGIFHKNTAARLKSRISKKANKAKK